MSDTTLRLDDIVKTYNRGKPNAVDVLRGAHLGLKRGEVAALVAPSGSGKSTLLHIAGLLDKPDFGSIEICGKDLSTADEETRTLARRRHIGFVYQSHHLLPEFTAEENIVLPQMANGLGHKEASIRAKALLDCVLLTGRGHHLPSELSGGEQQRVAICRALANSPSLLLADEPTGNLDPTTSGQVFRILMKICKQTGLSALIATHNMELASKMDKIIELQHGLTSEVSEPSNIAV